MTETAGVPVLLVEDDAMVREWIESALENTDFVLTGVASTAAEAVELAAIDRPELVLTDYRLPDRLGTELVQELRLRRIVAPVVVMTANPERGLNERAREAGAQGTVLKGSRAELLEALRAARYGEQSFDGRHPEQSPARASLDPRERAVLQLVASGQKVAEIAIALGTDLETTKTTIRRTYEKLGIRSPAEASAAARELNLL